MLLRAVFTLPREQARLASRPVAGGMASWFRQGKWRRAARAHEADAQRARSQLADLRSQVAREGQQRYPALASAGQGGNQAGIQGGIYGSAGRDKQGAAL